jgi:RimJ/RimL family protein N-acetyltransferase
MKVSFRPVRRGDLKRLRDIVDDADVARFLSIIPPVTMQSTIKHYEHCKKTNAHWYCILADGDVAGSAALHPYDKGSKNAHVTSFGISIAKEYWGRGIGKKTMRFLIDRAKSLGFKKIVLNVVADNSRALRLYDSSGFKKEGLQRRHTRIGNRYYDSLLMGRFL